MVKRGKRYMAASAIIDRERNYEPVVAAGLIKQISAVKFDETVELHMSTEADPRHADQLIRGVVLLPHGLGKTVRVLVFAQGDAARHASDAGADYVGDDDLIKRIEGGWVEFDVAIATPEMMGKVGRLGKVLGRRGLMPNPRTGTVVRAEGIARSVSEARQGRVEVRMDRSAIIHVPIGKVSFEDTALIENLASVIETVVKARPAGVKGQFIRAAYMTTTMGPSIRLDLSTLLELKVE
jgi:large subunit ribosomal protein L1